MIGALLTLPGASDLAGLHDIHDLKYSTTATVLIVVGFNLVLLWLLEVPLACFVIAPDWTPRAIERAKAWVSQHAHVFAVRGFAALGTLLVIKGIIGLDSSRPCNRHGDQNRSRRLDQCHQRDPPRCACPHTNLGMTNDPPMAAVTESLSFARLARPTRADIRSHEATSVRS